MTAQVMSLLSDIVGQLKMYVSSFDWNTVSERFCVHCVQSYSLRSWYSFCPLAEEWPGGVDLGDYTEMSHAVIHASTNRARRRATSLLIYSVIYDEKIQLFSPSSSLGGLGMLTMTSLASVECCLMT